MGGWKLCHGCMRILVCHLKRAVFTVSSACGSLWCKKISHSMMRTGGCYIPYFNMVRALLIVGEDARCHFWGKRILQFLHFSRFSSKFSSSGALFFHQTHCHILTMRQKMHVILKKWTITCISFSKLYPINWTQNNHVLHLKISGWPRYLDKFLDRYLLW